MNVGTSVLQDLVQAHIDKADQISHQQETEEADSILLVAKSNPNWEGPSAKVKSFDLDEA